MRFCAPPCDVCDYGVVSSKSSMVMSKATEVDINGCESGAGRRAIVGNI